MQKQGKWVCDLCGGTRVQGKLWVNLNDCQIDEDIELVVKMASSHFFCQDCEEITTVHFVKDYYEGSLKKRSK